MSDQSAPGLLEPHVLVLRWFSRPAGSQTVAMGPWLLECSHVAQPVSKSNTCAGAFWGLFQCRWCCWVSLNQDKTRKNTPFS